MESAQLAGPSYYQPVRPPSCFVSIQLIVNMEIIIQLIIHLAEEDISESYFFANKISKGGERDLTFFLLSPVKSFLKRHFCLLLTHEAIIEC
jgi:hypothetical protein